MKQLVEQIDNFHDIKIAEDQILSNLEIKLIFENIFLSCNCKLSYLDNLKRKNPPLLIETFKDKYLILYAQVTYLGKPHPKYKKRIQIPKKWIEYYNLNSLQYKVKFIGIYKYNENIIFVDFDPISYVKRPLNNSSAHIYTNDLYQAMINNSFRKKDKNNNIITTVKKNNFYYYLFHNKFCTHEVLNIIKKFNSQFMFNQDILGIEAYTVMYNNKYNNALQSEWGGFYLEYKFKEFIDQSKCHDILNYNNENLDFDLWSDTYKFYCDLKCSGERNRIVILNDMNNIIKAIEQYGMLWIILYEHTTILDSDLGFKTTLFWNELLGKSDMTSYSNRMKGVIKFTKMKVIEINKVNYKLLLDVFKQGINSNGNKRNPKFSLDKLKLSNLDDNFVIYRH